MEGASGGMSLATLLTVIYVVLKLTGNIAWSWLWVFSPLWISVLLGFGIMVGLALFAGALSKGFNRHR